MPTSERRIHRGLAWLALALWGAGCEQPPGPSTSPGPASSAASAALFAPALCTLPSPTLATAPVSPEHFAGEPIWMTPLQLDETHLLVGGQSGSLGRIALTTGQTDGHYLLGSARAQKGFSVIGSDAELTYLWSVSDTGRMVPGSDGRESLEELFAVNFAAQTERTLATATTDSPWPTSPQLMDGQNIYWFSHEQQQNGTLLATDKQGQNRRTLVQGSAMVDLVQDADQLYWLQIDEGSPATTSVRSLAKTGGQPGVVIRGLPGQVRLQRLGGSLFVAIDQTGHPSCDRTVFRYGGDGPLQAVVRAPLSGGFAPLERGVLWQSHADYRDGIPARIWFLDSGRATELVVGAPRVLGPTLLGARGGWFYWRGDRAVFRAQHP